MKTRLLCLLLAVSHPVFSDSWDTTAREASKDGEIRAYRMVKLSRACGRVFSKIVRVPFGTRRRAIFTLGSAALTYLYFAPLLHLQGWESEMDELLATTMDELDTDEEKEEMARKLATAEIAMVQNDLHWNRFIVTRMLYYPLRWIATGDPGALWSDRDIAKYRDLEALIGDRFKDWKAAYGDHYIVHRGEVYEMNGPRIVDEADFVPPDYLDELIPIRAEGIAKTLKHPNALTEMDRETETSMPVSPRLVTVGRLNRTLLTRIGPDQSMARAGRKEKQIRSLLSKNLSELEGVSDREIAVVLANEEFLLVQEVANYELGRNPEVKRRLELLEKVAGKSGLDFPYDFRKARQKTLMAELASLRKRNPGAKLEELAKEVPFFTADDLERLLKEEK